MGTTEGDTPGPSETWRIVAGSWHASLLIQVIHCLFDIGAVREMSETPRTILELSRRLHVDAAALTGVLRLAATIGLVEERGDKRFALTAAGLGLRDDDLRAAVTMMAGPLYLSARSLGHAVRTGSPAFDDALGVDFATYTAAHPDMRAGYYATLAADRDRFTRALLSYDWTGVRTVLDVGGGDGRVAAELTSAHPHLNVIVLDRSESAIPRSNLPDADRISYIVSDAKTAYLPPCDVYLFVRVLNTLPDDAASALLERCARAGGMHSTILILEGMYTDAGKPSYLDLLTLIMFGAKVRSSADYRALLAPAGFRVDAITSHPGGVGLIEGRAKLLTRVRATRSRSRRKRIGERPVR